jgi:hypothetical protein
MNFVKAVFRDDEGRQKSLVKLAEACGKTEWPGVAPLPAPESDL